MTTLLLLSFFLKRKFSLKIARQCKYLFLVLIAMLVSFSATPQVTADFTTNTATTGCGSLLVEFEDLSTGSPISWLWDFGNGNTSNLQNPVAIYSNPGFYDVVLKVTDGVTTNVKTMDTYVKVYDEPTADLQANSLTTGCIPLIVNFSDNSSSSSTIATWQWNFGDGGSSNLQTPSYNFENDGIFSVSLSVVDANGCQSLATEIDLVDVNKVPLADFESDIKFSCNASELVSFTNNTINASSFMWDFGDGATSNLVNPTHTFNSGVYTITLCAKEGGCVDTLVFSDYIEIGGSLAPDFNVNTNSGCEGLNVVFTDITANNPNTFFWDFGDGVTSNIQHPSHVYSNTGIFDISLTTSISGQCATTFTFPNKIEVFEKPIIDFVADTTYACSFPFSVDFTDNTVNASNWTWDLGNGTTSVLNNPSVTYANYGLYDVNLTVTNTNGCNSTETVVNMIEVEKIQVDITTNSIEGCVPFDVDLTDATLSSRPLVDWSWNFGDGTFSNSQNPTHNYSTSGVFDVSLLVFNDYGCLATQTFPSLINSNEKPIVNFSASPVISCAGENINFSDLSTLGTNNWEWSFGDGSSSTLQNPTYQYSLTGLYNISLVAGINNCKDTLSIPAFIKIIEPTAIFEEVYNCDNPYSVEFSNLSIGADDVLWDFGDGSTSILTNPSHVFSTIGIHTVSLTVSNTLTGCSHTFVKQIKITIPVAQFDYLINSANGYEDSVGCVPNTVYIDNQSQDWSHYKVLWSDGYIGYGRQDHTFTTAGDFDVTLIITDPHGCKDTLVRNNMYHMHDVEADFGIANVLGCDSMLVDFVDLTVPVSDVNWVFGDGGTSNLNNPQYIYYNEGFYDVTVFAESAFGCKDTLKRVEYIQFQYPTADFSSNIQGICPGDNVDFTNLSIGVGINFNWSFGDGTSSSVQNPLHEYLANGVYGVNLLVTDSFGCMANLGLSSYIEVLAPVASFSTAGLSSDCPPLISDFTNSSSADVTDFQWSFGDGGSSSIENPSHLFTNSGVFDVSLVVENSFGCKDTLVQNGMISIAGPTGSFTISDTLICKDEPVVFTPTVVNTNSFIWDFGNGIISNDSIPTHAYVLGGSFIPVLIIENNSGCQFTVPQNDTIVVREVIVDAGIDAEICIGESVQLNAIGNASDFVWIGTALSSNIIANPLASPLNDVTYFVSNSDGLCSAIDSLTIQVHEEVPVASFTADKHCDGDTLVFMANSGLLTLNNSFEWSFGQTGQLVSSQLVLGNNEIMLIVQNLNNSCSDTLVENVEIFPLPVAEFDATTVCLGELMQFSDNSSVNTTNWEYDFNDGTANSTSHNPSHNFLTPGVYNVDLLVVSDMGCENETTREVYVNHLPEVDFSIENTCLGNPNIFVNLSSVEGSSINNVSFDFGNSNFSTDSVATFTYLYSGVFGVTLTATSKVGCENSITKTAEVFDLPEVDFTTSQFCFGLPTQFVDYTTIADAIIIDWLWSFDDGLAVTSSQHPEYKFTNTGTFNVSLTATSNMGCEFTKTEEVRIYDLPKVNFEINSDICLNEVVKINDLSDSDASEITKWNYTFGDGTSSADQHPIHTFSYINQFDVTLTVTTLAACENDTTIKVNVHSLPTANFQASTLITSEIDSEIEFFNISEGASEILWDFDNGVTSIVNNPTLEFSNIGNYDVLLTAISEFGCEDNIIRTVSVNPEYTIFIPSAFTPDGDGVNDIFTAKGNAVESFEMQVYDRWGGIVFVSNSIDYGWDGKNVSGDWANNGFYLYQIVTYDRNGRLWVYNGELNLMR